MANFDTNAARALFLAVKSQVDALGVFQGSVTHDPENAPGNRLFCSITLGPIKAVTSSGLAAVSGQITFFVRVWSSAMQRPLDDIDPEVLGAVSALMGAFSGGFTLGGTVRDIDLMALSAQPAYIEFDGKQFRTVEITVPVVVNDLWQEMA